jgi:cytochrome c oxidase subunit II
VLLTFTSKDVIHSFWVPEWSQKQDTVPGIHPTLHITPNKVGRFPVICTELCGLGHSVMRTWAVVMSPAAYDKWLAGQKRATTSPNTAVSGEAVFKNNQCAACHTFKPANATGTVGPDLDKLAEYAQAAGQDVEAFTKESITDPSAYTEKGFPKGVMPPFDLPDDQLAALVQYLTKE